MKYISTRGQAPALDFDDALLAGLARDGGLYLPESWPQFSADEIRAMRGLSYAEIATKVMAPFVAGLFNRGPEGLATLATTMGIAALFGGGGHPAAAGARIAGTQLATQRRVIAAIKKALKAAR